MESENTHDFDTTIGTFSHPRYELIATGEVYDGEREVRDYYAETRAAFPDQRNELISLRHSDDAVIAEFDLLGTHLGRLRSLPPTGRSFRARMVAFFIFDGAEIVCERVYFDQASILRQLGVAHDPTSLAGRVSTAVTSADDRRRTGAIGARPRLEPRPWRGADQDGLGLPVLPVHRLGLHERHEHP